MNIEIFDIFIDIIIVEMMFFFDLICDLIFKKIFVVGLLIGIFFFFVDVNLLFWREKVVDEIY